MKKLQVINLLILICMSVNVFSQNTTGSIIGKIADEAGGAVASATISLKSVKDSSIVKMTAADETGAFSFENILFNTYFIEVSAIGFMNYSSAPIILSVSSAIHTEPTISLGVEAKSSEGVTIVSRRPVVEAKPGMMVVNVDAAPSNMGLNALELLEKSPGITLDNDGNISLKGKQGVLVLIDGKPTYMSGTDLTAFLRTLQSSSIASLEIMTNPPARYDAAGNSGIINIKTKKTVIKGMNGSASATYTQSYYPRANGSVNLNYRNEKINIFGGYNVYRYEGFNQLTLDRVFYENDKVTPNSYSDQVSRPRHWGNGHNLKVGADYYFSQKQILGVLVNLNTSNNNENSWSDVSLYDVNRDKTTNFYSEGRDRRTSTNFTANLNYKTFFEKSGSELTADADVAYYNTDRNSLLESDIQNLQIPSSDEMSLRGDIPSLLRIYSVKADFVRPFKENWKFEAGVKSSWVNSDNKIDYLRSDNGSGWVPDNRSNHFIFDENINAAYAIVSGTVNKWSINAGLRVENTVMKGHQVVNDSSFTRNYTNLFPNVGFGYNMNDNNQLNLSYSRRISRPSYGDLNPFIFFLDSLTYNQGNPFLMPEFTQNLEFTHAYKGFLFTTLNYSVTHDVIAEMLKQNTADKTTYQTNDNVAKRSQIGLSVMMNLPVTKWWNFNTYLNVYNNKYTGIYNNDPLDIAFTTFMGSITNNFNFGNGWGAELGGWYRSKGTEGLLVINGLYAVNGGITKQVLNKKGTIRLSVRDAFWSQIATGYAKYSDINLNLKSVNDSRRVSIGFTYRFGKTNIKQARDRKTGLEDEKSRVSNGGQG